MLAIIIACHSSGSGCLFGFAHEVGGATGAAFGIFGQRARDAHLMFAVFTFDSGIGKIADIFMIFDIDKFHGLLLEWRELDLLLLLASLAASPRHDEPCR